jgi:hypothetical protein
VLDLHGGLRAIEAGDAAGAGHVLQLRTQHQRRWQGVMPGTGLHGAQARLLGRQRRMRGQRTPDGHIQAQGFGGMRNACRQAHPDAGQDGNEMQ